MLKDDGTGIPFRCFYLNIAACHPEGTEGSGGDISRAKHI
jgi:hypothetical protein